MLVDPNTGLPMEDQPQRRSMVGGAITTENKVAGAVSAFAQDTGVAPPSGVLDASTNAVPGGLKSTAWNIYRGSRTMAFGGVNGKAQITGINSTLNPRYFGRFSSMKAMGGVDVESSNRIFRASKYGQNQAYTPFNNLYRMGNAVVGGRAGLGAMADKSIARRAAVAAADPAAAPAKSGGFATRMSRYAGEEGDAFARGTLGRITAADKMARGKLPTSNMLGFLQETDKGLANAYRTSVSGIGFNEKSLRYQNTATGRFVSSAKATQALSGVTATGDDAARLAYASVNGSISGRASGFMAQMRLGTAGAAGQEAAELAGKKSFVAGTQSAARFMERAGIERVAATATSKGFFQATGAFGPGISNLSQYGVKAGQKVGMKTAGKVAAKGGIKLGAKLGAAAAVNAIPVAGQVMSLILLADLAMDVGKIGVEVFKSGVDFAKDAAISYKGSINKGVMGMGYRDSTVAATSRARGVQAIQNSRLNARSVLGSEAGAMHAHFG
jgi:hypothetical protein